MFKGGLLEIFFIDILKLISQRSRKSFTGIGILLYDQKFFVNDYFSDLRPSYKPPKLNLIGKETIINYLLDITDETNYLHDGFIFFNEIGNLTHVSQYFAPIPRGKIIPNEKYGTRYRTAQYGSLLRGIILTGTINHDKKYHIFRNGKCINNHQ